MLPIRHSDNDAWALPGGVDDLGKPVPPAAIRETREETGITCEDHEPGRHPQRSSLHVATTRVRQEFLLVLTARPIGGHPTPSSESREVRWVPRHEVSDYGMHRSMRLRISHYPQGGSPHIS
ncbi:hypothetical protein GCM10022419_062010 [Nonomuraea rosea]|uniref:Nudix hydrolase domain-containing protein n=1 Tax=Nonomuraea rosea TaxID=638574 RepID=A0ABP6XUG9_9ACTN